MKTRFAAYAAIIALSTATTVAAHAVTMNNPAQDQAENQITAQLNQQQVENGNYGVETYQGIMQRQSQGAPQEQIAQPPDAGDLSIIE
ncbi:MAG TPA: hypothetical protein VGL83_03400 [Stellaceae bacterium]|jgi:hypothetical protein